MATLTFGCTFSDRIEAFLDRRVGVDDFDLALSIVEPQKLFRQTVREATFDIAELSMGSHIAAVGRGTPDYVGLPVFLSRSFRHSNLYVRTDRGIERPEDLAGRRIGLVDFQQTAALWLRGVLADDHGVSRESIRWITAGLHAPVLDDRAPMALPAGIHVTRSSSTLDDLLARGEIDAVISPAAPRCFIEHEAPVDRLWRDYRREEIAYWRRRALFPIMHVAVLRRSLAERNPGLAGALCGAFEQARQIAINDLAHRDFPKVTMPWLNHHAADCRQVLGSDPWTYGIEDNRAVLATMLRYAWQDGLTDRGLTVEDLFA